MPSPFPGMDPYLEPHWLDVHGTLVTECRRWLNRHLPPGLVARSEDRVAVESELEMAEPTPRPPIGPDVRVITSPGRGAIPSEAATLEVDAPFRLAAGDGDPIIEHFVRVIDATGLLIAVVEVVSPTNKRGRGLTRYRRDRRNLLASGVHVVEVDLCRSGSWRALMQPLRCPPAAAAMFRAVVRTAGTGFAYLFPMPLRQPLCDVAVPLRPGDPKLSLPVQDLFTAVYDDGRYGDTLDYAQPPDPPLVPDDAAWAAALLAGRGSA